METLAAFLPYIQIIISILMILAILLQQTGSDLGGAFGGGDSGAVKYTRRGFEKTLFRSTFVLAILFVLSALLSLTL